MEFMEKLIGTDFSNKYITKLLADILKTANECLIQTRSPNQIADI